MMKLEEAYEIVGVNVLNKLIEGFDEETLTMYLNSCEVAKTAYVSFTAKGFELDLKRNLINLALRRRFMDSPDEIDVKVINAKAFVSTLGLDEYTNVQVNNSLDKKEFFTINYFDPSL